MNNRPIRVLSVCTSDSSGGAAKAAYRIHQAVQSFGVASRMFVKDKGMDNPTVLSVDDFIPHNAFYRGFDWVRNKVKNKWQHYQWKKYPDSQKYFMSDLRSTDIGHALQKIDYDILHLHWINLRFLPLNQLPKDKPIVWTLHDSWPFCGVCHYFYDCTGYKKECGNCPSLSSTRKNDLSHKTWKKKQSFYQGLDLQIVTPSKWLGECAGNSSLFRKCPIFIIPNCIDTAVFHPLHDDVLSPRWQTFIDRKRNTTFLLYGAMNAATDRRKGFSYLLSAIRHLKRYKPDPTYELIVFGANEPLEGLSSIIPIHYVGFISDPYEIVSLYNIASVMLVPSLNENLSCVIMESLSCGTPVVAFNIGGNGDMINHKVNGYLALEKDDDDFAQGILWCLSQNKEKLSIAARQTVIERFSPNIVGQQYLSLYNRLIMRQ